MGARKMRIIITIAFLLAVAECRRHLCDDGSRPRCADGSHAVYNRPTGKNTKHSTYYPPPACSGPGQIPPAKCDDGSDPAHYRFNVCKDEDKKCATGKGFGPHDKPRPACPKGGPCKCPGGGKHCLFKFRRCPDGSKCHYRCRDHKQPHCPWWTKDRNEHDGIKIYNTGIRRPGNFPEGHHWGPDYAGNRP